MKKLSILVPPVRGGKFAGDFKTTTSGFAGGECKQASAEFQQIIGGEVISDQATPEMMACDGAGDPAAAN